MRAYAEELLGELERLRTALGERLSVDGLVDAAKGLRESAAGLSGDAERVNRALMRMSRALVPMDYTSGDRFAHDPALALPAWPTLQPLRALAGAAADSDQARLLTVDAVRARNRVAHALREANAATWRALREHTA